MNFADRAHGDGHKAVRSSHWRNAPVVTGFNIATTPSFRGGPAPIEKR